MPSSIANNEVGSSVRGKLNEALAMTPSKLYRALLTQASTSAPVATVLINTLGGTVVWTRSVAGQYLGTLAGAFPAGKTFLLIYWDSGGGTNTVDLTRADDDTVFLLTQLLGVDGDGILLGASIEIAVYP